jgi:pilus assembly protein CpaF
MGEPVIASLDRYAAQLRGQTIAEARANRHGFDSDAQSLREYVRALVAREAPALSAELREELAERVVVGALGFGELEPLLADPSVDEIMVNGSSGVWVERHGRLERQEVSFESPAALENLIERIVAPLGRRIDEASPICDARLPDGSRVNVVIPPLALGGPVLTIRRFRHAGLGPEQLVENGTLSARALEFLAAAVRARISMVVSGGTGSGKTTTLNALSEYIPGDERIVTIEDAAELRLRQGHVVRLEARPANIEGGGEVTIRSLVRTALRMRPDRILVGEVRGGEALDMLAAMNIGHDGSLTTVHANSAAGALARIETLALMAGVDVPFAAVQRQVASAIELVVHQERTRSGGRRVAAISEVLRRVDGGYELRDLMRLTDGDEQWIAPRADRLAALIDAVAGE